MLGEPVAGIRLRREAGPLGVHLLVLVAVGSSVRIRWMAVLRKVILVLVDSSTLTTTSLSLT